MKVAAARAIASLAHEDVPESISQAYNSPDLKFGPDYILPKPFDPRLLTVVAPAVIQAAKQSGVATRNIDDIAKYKDFLNEIICTNKALIDYLIKSRTTCARPVKK